jgi:hypothetical protein
MTAQRTKVAPTRTCDPPEPGRDEVWAQLRGRKVHGVYSVADGWVEVIADDGRTRTARCGDSSAAAVAERLLGEVYTRSAEG